MKELDIESIDPIALEASVKAVNGKMRAINALFGGRPVPVTDEEVLEVAQEHWEGKIDIDAKAELKNSIWYVRSCLLVKDMTSSERLLEELNRMAEKDIIEDAQATGDAELLLQMMDKIALGE